jgi:alpha/beta superfamily hydrolase
VLLCRGFAGIKELLLPAHAERFQKAGVAALTFDYRGFGGSEGEPGGWSRPNK